MISKEEYFEYLNTRSKLGLVYRMKYLYPTLNKYLPGKTLDIGCGIGDFLNYKKDSIGLDINEMNVSYCQSLGLNVQTMEPDVLGFEDDSFESIILDNVLEHIDNPVPLLIEVSRVCKPNGQVIFGVPGKKGYSWDSDHKQFYDEARLVETIETYGFKKVVVKKMPLPFNFLTNYLKNFCLYGVFKKVP